MGQKEAKVVPLAWTRDKQCVNVSAVELNAIQAGEVASSAYSHVRGDSSALLTIPHRIWESTGLRPPAAVMPQIHQTVRRRSGEKIKVPLGLIRTFLKLLSISDFDVAGHKQLQLELEP